jgi:hypothetical protein
MQTDNINRYMQHHFLAQAEPQWLGKFKFPITNHNSNCNASQGASDIQYNSFNTDFILQKLLSLQQVRNISPSFQKLWC